VLKMDFKELLFDFVADTLIEKFSLSQAFALVYYSMKSTLQFMTKYNPDKARITSNFRNNIYRSAERYDSKTAYRFFRPSNINLSTTNSIINGDVLHVVGDYFYQKTDQIVPNYQELYHSVALE